MLPKQVFAGAKGQRHFVYLTILSVRAVEANTHMRTGIVKAIPMPGQAGIVHGVEAGPFVIRLPREIGALKKQVRWTPALHDENHIALDRFLLQSHLAEVNTAWPIVRDLQLSQRAPLAFTYALHAH